jgi:hypothetical protein
MDMYIVYILYKKCRFICNTEVVGSVVWTTRPLITLLDHSVRYSVVLELHIHLFLYSSRLLYIHL